MKLLALSLLPLISATTHPTQTKHLLPRSPHNILPSTLAPLLSLPTTSSTPSVPGSVYVCEKPNSEGHCRYLGEDQVPGAEQCHVIDEGITLGSIEPAAFSTCTLFTVPTCDTAHAHVAYADEQALSALRPYTAPGAIAPWLKSFRCSVDAVQLKNNETFAPRREVRLEPCGSADCSSEPWGRWVERYPPPPEGADEFKGVRPAHEMVDYASVRSKLVAGGVVNGKAGDVGGPIAVGTVSLKSRSSEGGATGVTPTQGESKGAEPTASGPSGRFDPDRVGFQNNFPRGV